MFVITDGCLWQCDIREQVGKNIVISCYLRPDTLGKEVAKRIGKIVAVRQFWTGLKDRRNAKLTSLITVEYENDNHYADKTVSSYNLDKIKAGVILPA